MSIPSADPYADAVWADDEPPPDDAWAPPADESWAPPADDGWMPGVVPAASAPIAPRAAAPRFATPLEALRTVFGYDAFRGNQAAAIEHIVDGGDAVVLMPTGGGKSLIYQVPALVRPGTGLVVSPLIALMHDQVDALVANGVRAAYLNSTQSGPERAAVERAYLSGQLDLIYVAPERLSSASTRGTAPAGRPERHRDRRGALRVAVGP